MADSPEALAALRRLAAESPYAGERDNARRLGDAMAARLAAKAPQRPPMTVQTPRPHQAPPAAPRPRTAPEAPPQRPRPPRMAPYPTAEGLWEAFGRADAVQQPQPPAAPPPDIFADEKRRNRRRRSGQAASEFHGTFEEADGPGSFRTVQL